jgi:F-type H+-transporting ATPase subunit b
MGEVFDRRLRELNGQAKRILGEALKKNSEPALIRSTFDLPEAQRAAIQNALNETFSGIINIRFETSPDLVSGIELSANGQKVGWSIADYLASLEKRVGELLKEKDKPAPQAEVKAEPKPEPALESKTEAKPESKNKAESERQPEVKPEAKSEVERAPKPEAKVEPVIKSA